MNLKQIVNNIRAVRSASLEEVRRCDSAIRLLTHGAKIGRPPGVKLGRPPKEKSVVRHLSAAGRKHIVKAQKERWAKLKAEQAGKSTE